MSTLTFEHLKEAAERLTLPDPVLSLTVSPRVSESLRQHIADVSNDLSSLGFRGITVASSTRIDESSVLPDNLYIEYHERYCLLKDLQTGRVVLEHWFRRFPEQPLGWIMPRFDNVESA